MTCAQTNWKDATACTIADNHGKPLSATGRHIGTYLSRLQFPSDFNFTKLKPLAQKSPSFHTLPATPLPSSLQCVSGACTAIALSNLHFLGNLRRTASLA